MLDLDHVDIPPALDRAFEHNGPGQLDALIKQEWAHLLRLHAAITLRSNYSAYTDAERQAAAEPMTARNLETQRLWMDGVADAHIADVLGLSDDAIIRARRQARAAAPIAGRTGIATRRL